MQNKELEELKQELTESLGEDGQEYLDFLDSKLEELRVQNEELFKAKAKENEDFLDTMPRAFRRKHTKKKFASSFYSKIKLNK